MGTNKITYKNYGYEYDFEVEIEGTHVQIIDTLTSMLDLVFAELVRHEHSHDLDNTIRYTFEEFENSLGLGMAIDEK